MSSTIPPLVSNTPPPIDFDNDDDFDESIDGTFGHYDDGKAIFENVSSLFLVNQKSKFPP